MCGIAGYINLDNSKINLNLLIKMNNTIFHRGPDDEGYAVINQSNSTFELFSGNDSCSEVKNKYKNINLFENTINGNIGFAHRRFSIIDLSENGHQPFFDKEKSCCIIFNGEIYNYLELKSFLIQKGINFSTNSDTEVLVEAYKYWGKDFLKQLNGFWAFALYDFSINKLFLSRDRVGKKPLYYSIQNHTIYFASEIKALLQINGISSNIKINEIAAANWLYFKKRDIDYSTFYNGIFSLPRASFIEVNNNFPNDKFTFWSYPTNRFSEKDITVTDATYKIKELLLNSTEIRLRADVPLCVELSGGMDSSALVAISSQVYKDKITTFTVEFEEKEWNEEPFAREVAQMYNVNYNVLKSPTNSFWANIEAFTYLQEEPYHSPNLQTNQMIWGMMRNNGMKVSLNGAGGDEIFAGYGEYFYHSQFENLVNFKIKNLINNLNWSEAGNKRRSIIYPFLYFLQNDPRFKSFNNLLQSEKLDNYILLPQIYSTKFKYTLSKKLLEEMASTKIPYWMRSGDKGFMGIPLEVRAPFLDYRLIEYVMQLPSSYLIRNGWQKWILRKSLEGILPEKVLWRKNKLGFPFPYNTFFTKYKKIIDLILTKNSTPYLDFKGANYFSKSWHIISFILWYEYFINNNVTLFQNIKDIAVSIDGYSELSFNHNYFNTYNNLRA